MNYWQKRPGGVAGKDPIYGVVRGNAIVQFPIPSKSVISILGKKFDFFQFLLAANGCAAENSYNITSLSKYSHLEQQRRLKKFDIG